jgi:hypothetical protein
MGSNGISVPSYTAVYMRRDDENRKEKIGALGIYRM